MIRTCSPDNNTHITHIVSVPPCCPISGNPRAGSALSISYTPMTGLVFPVEDLEKMIREYVGGLGSIRAMEEMIQHIHRRVSDAVGVDVMVKADLRIAPPHGGDEQGMVIEVGSDMLTTLAAENATLREEQDDAFARGMAHGQKAMPKGTFNVVDSPELATLRASEAAAVERVRVLTEALRIAGPIALKDYARHPFILLGAEQEAVSVIERGVEALTPPKTEGAAS